MKNTLYSSILILVIGALAWFGLPWWSVAIAGILAAWFFPVGLGRSTAIGFAAGYLLWYFGAMFFDSANASMLSGKVGKLFLGLQSWQLMAITGTIGGLLATCGMITGYYARALFVGRKQIV